MIWPYDMSMSIWVERNTFLSFILFTLDFILIQVLSLLAILSGMGLVWWRLASSWCGNETREPLLSRRPLSTVVLLWKLLLNYSKHLKANLSSAVQGCFAICLHRPTCYGASGCFSISWGCRHPQTFWSTSWWWVGQLRGTKADFWRAGSWNAWFSISTWQQIFCISFSRDTYTA